MKAGHSNRIYFLTDALSSVRDICRGSDGAVLQSYDYKENGEKTVANPSEVQSAKTWVGGLSVNDDTGDSGLYLMGHRHYDSSTARFLSRDPIGFDGGLNLYSYGNSPVDMIDPAGLTSLVGVFVWSAVKSAAYGFALGAITTAAFAAGTVGGAIAGTVLVAGAFAYGAYQAIGAVEKYYSGAWTGEDSAALAGGIVGGMAGGWAGNRWAASRFSESPAQATLKRPCEDPPMKSAARGPTMPTPPIPAGMNLSTFGKVIGWGTGNQAALNRIGHVNVQAVRSAGITSPMARSWARFYENVTMNNPGNPSSAGRVPLMDHVADILE